MISTAIGLERVAQVLGYEIKKGNFAEATPNLPMRIVVLGQANNDKQGSITANEPVEVFSEQEAGEAFGFGSQIHQMMRILRPVTGDTLVGGIPTIVIPQVEGAGAAAEVRELTVTGGPATKNTTIQIQINGRTAIDGESFSVGIASGDAVADVAASIADAINNSQRAPVTASAALGVVTLTTKWRDITAGDLDIQVLTAADGAAGLTYAVTQASAAAGTGSDGVPAALAALGTAWSTIVVNPYPASADGSFEAANGVPGTLTTATGRYAPDVFLPFVALRGSRVADTVANVIASTDASARKAQATIVTVPAPNSLVFDHEVAANGAALLARQAQDSPHTDMAGQRLFDCPIPASEDPGVFSVYNNRDAIVKGGHSAAIIKNGQYEITDFITTYHPDGENPPQFRYVRSLIQDWNIRYQYFLLEQINVVNKALVGSDQAVNVSNTIKPDTWKGILFRLADNLAENGIIAEPDFMKESIVVGSSETVPDRLETSFRYKRSGFTRILSTTATAGFAFGLR